MRELACKIRTAIVEGNKTRARDRRHQRAKPWGHGPEPFQKKEEGQGVEITSP